MSFPRVFLSAAFILLSVNLLSAEEENIGGSWHGRLLVTPQVALTIVFNFTDNGDGTSSVTVDSPEQGIYGVPGIVEKITPDEVSFSVAELRMSFAGDRHGEDRIDGVFTQGPLRTMLILYPGKREIRRTQLPEEPYARHRGVK